jgi:hypothetical protein
MRAALTFVFFALASAGCAGPTWSCSYGGDCEDYVSGYDEGSIRAECSAGMGVFSSSSACPSSGRVARCTETVTQSAYTHTLTRSYYAPHTTAEVQSSCPPTMPASATTYQFQAN